MNAGSALVCPVAPGMPGNDAQPVLCHGSTELPAPVRSVWLRFSSRHNPIAAGKYLSGLRLSPTRTIFLPSMLPKTVTPPKFRARKLILDGEGGDEFSSVLLNVPEYEMIHPVQFPMVAIPQQQV